jgi:hypothetical protein
VVTERAFPFVVSVALFDTAEEPFEFDQDEVVVGRGRDVDLQLAHPAVSRRQLTIQRIVPPIGRPRFRIVPHAAKNDTYVNGVPAVEGSLAIGDVVAVGETRLTLRRATRRAGARRLTPLRAAILVVGVLAVALVARNLLEPPGGASEGPLPALKLFARLPQVSCPDLPTCTERARTAYTHGRTYTKQAASLPGAWYKASLSFYRAAEFQRHAGRPLPGLEDVRERLKESAAAAEAIYNDLQFRLTRDLAGHDPEALRATIAQLIAAVPDEEHPIRQRLALYLRDHPLPVKEPKR